MVLVPTFGKLPHLFIGDSLLEGSEKADHDLKLVLKQLSVVLSIITRDKYAADLLDPPSFSAPHPAICKTKVSSSIIPIILHGFSIRRVSHDMV